MAAPGSAVGKVGFQAGNVLTDGFAHSLAVPVPLRDGFIEDAPGVFGHTEPSVIDLVVHLFGRMAHERQLKIVNDARAVHGDGGNEPLLHPGDENGSETDLDHVRADSDNHRPAFAMCPRNSARHGAERPDGKNIGKRSIEQTEAATLSPGLGEIGDPHLAVTLLERIGF
jgi:hypothetical protein